MFVCCRYTVQNIVAILEGREKDVDGIFIEPPDAAVDSDEDSADEDGGGLIDNLTGRQLRAGAQVVFADGTRLGDPEDDVGDDGATEPAPSEQTSKAKEPARKRRRGNKGTTATWTRDGLPTADPPFPEGDEPLQCKQTSKAKGPARNRRKDDKGTTTTWTRDDLPTADPPFPEADYSAFRCLSPAEVFETLFTGDILQLIVDECTRYALYSNCADPRISKEEMKIFIAVLVLSGYNVLPGKRFYWATSDDVRNELVYNAIRRDRFIQIMRFLHFADSTKPNLTDKMWKLRPLMSLLKRNFQAAFRPTKHLDYDESMIAYYGRHGCKQFIRGKPIRFGYKVWSMNSSVGYLINFEVYQGKNPVANTDYEETFGKAAAPLVQMIDEFSSDVQQLPFNFYFDNLFTGISLLRELKKRGYGATGTIRDNRVPRDCPIASKKDMTKQPRGSTDHVIKHDDKILISRWVDNSVVTMASTIHGMLPSSSVQRYSRSLNKTVAVSRPFLFSEYNKGMGGTDRMDENVSIHRIGIRGKKWWWPIFTWLVDVTIHNAWILAKGAGCHMTQLQFKRELVQTYLRRYGLAPKGGGRPSLSKASLLSDSRVSDALRFDGRAHLVYPTTGGKRRRCAGGACASVGRTECRKCNVGLCVACFATFHTK